MSYETAPATKLLATHCAACARPLVDAVSVETGMGPDCREKYGVFEGVSDNRDVANKIVYVVALAAGNGAAPDAEHINLLNKLGYTKLAKRLMERTCKINISVSGESLIVKTPYNDNPMYLNAWRSIPGRKWDKANKCNIVPATSKRAVWELLTKWFVGFNAVGPKGAFTIGGAS